MAAALIIAATTLIYLASWMGATPLLQASVHMLVLMAIVSTAITTPALKRWLQVQPVAELEQGRVA